MEKKGDLSDLNVEWLLVRRAGLRISHTADLLGFSHTTISSVYREWSEKEKISNERQCVDNNASLMSEVRGEWTDC